jgi:hydrogenase maturation protein HypF
MTTARSFIKVFGIVQGVGFRPYVYNLAISLGLKGWVNNNSEGVYINLEGSKEHIKAFINELKTSPPPLARIEAIEESSCEAEGFESFEIRDSERMEQSITLISPDIALCKECREDILNPENRRFGYAFTNCTNCGPRFSIIKAIPYDRNKTTMKKFHMCDNCQEEYTNPTNRRFHAQPNACSVCGPSLSLLTKFGEDISLEQSDAYKLQVVREKLLEGKVFAIKGLTGFHLCCNAKDEKAVEQLRLRKKRPFKPFAVMMKDLTVVKKYCEVSSVEENLLTGIRKPIVLLSKKADLNLPQAVAPKQTTLGVMLPYTPLHELLFSGDIEVLIMTSANYYSLPLEYENRSAVDNLSEVADYFLVHNRDIFLPVDDSVVKVTAGRERMIRRARGYAPEPFTYKNINEILALGPNMKNTFAIGKENFIFLSQHNGDLENLETIERYDKNIEHFRNIFAFTPKYIAYDMHPDYYSADYALKKGVRNIQVQHHHAHIASCLVENKVRNKVIGVSYDGTGYGDDNKIWGGEFLICDLRDYHRAAHLDYTSLPGGEKAIKEPWRTAAAYIYKAYLEETDIEDINENIETILKNLYGEKSLVLLKTIKSGINCVGTSSMGRLFDAVSSILNICNEVTYEGQASIELESAVHNFTPECYSYSIYKKAAYYIINPNKIIIEILRDKLSKIDVGIISAKFHNTVISFTLDICCRLREQWGINEVALSGGVFQNSYILEKLSEVLEKNSFTVYSQSSFPSNDGGIAIGQIAVANEQIKNFFYSGLQT